MGVRSLVLDTRMVTPKPPHSPPIVADSSVLETAFVTVSTTLAIVLTAATAFAAASVVGDDSPLGLAISLAVGPLTFVALVVGAKAISRRLTRELDRRRSATTGSQPRTAP